MADSTHDRPRYRAALALDDVPTAEVVLDAEVVPPPVLDAEVVGPAWHDGSPPVILWRVGLITARAVASSLEWVFGAAVLTVGLAVLAAVPVLQFLSLGYLLEAGGRVARTGRFRDGFIGVRLAARLGGIVVSTWLFLLPVRLVAGFAETAAVIDPGGPAADRWRVGLFVLIALTFFHVLTAIACGGRFRHFLWPFNFVWLLVRAFRGGYYGQARDAVWDTVMALRLPYYFWLGLRGFAAALVWLALPVTMMVLGHVPAQLAPLFGIAGALLMGLALLYVPFLQMRMAQQDRFAAAFDLVAVRAEFRRAPWMFSFAFVVALISALPLYLLKIEVVPGEAAWLPGLVFIAFIFPARLLAGMALACATHRPKEAHWFFRWTGRFVQPGIAALYVLFLFITQYTSWNGIWSLYEQHAFLLPVPFFGS